MYIHWLVDKFFAFFIQIMAILPLLQKVCKTVAKTCMICLNIKKKNDVPVKANSRLNDSQKEIKKKTRKIRINYLMVLFFTDRYILR